MALGLARCLVMSFVVCVSLLGAGCAASAVSPAEAAKLVDPPPDEQASEALSALQLSVEQQQAVAALGAKLRESLRSTEQARAQLVEGVLAALSSGAFDRGRIDALAMAFVASSDEARPAILAAADELHALLTPAQRMALVEKLEPRGDDGEHAGKRRAEQVVAALRLGLSQRIAIAKAVKERFAGLKGEVERLRQQLRAAAVAFKSDDFHAASLELARAPVISHWVEVAVSLLETVAAQLDAEPRLTLVAIARRMLASQSFDATK